MPVSGFWFKTTTITLRARCGCSSVSKIQSTLASMTSRSKTRSITRRPAHNRPFASLSGMSSLNFLTISRQQCLTLQSKTLDIKLLTFSQRALIWLTRSVSQGFLQALPFWSLQLDITWLVPTLPLSYPQTRSSLMCLRGSKVELTIIYYSYRCPTIVSGVTRKQICLGHILLLNSKP